MSVQPVIEARGLCKEYRVSGENSLFPRTFSAVRDVSFAVYPGENDDLVPGDGCF